MITSQLAKILIAFALTTSIYATTSEEYSPSYSLINDEESLLPEYVSYSYDNGCLNITKTTYQVLVDPLGVADSQQKYISSFDWVLSSPDREEISILEHSDSASKNSVSVSVGHNTRILSFDIIEDMEHTLAGLSTTYRYGDDHIWEHGAAINRSTADSTIGTLTADFVSNQSVGQAGDAYAGAIYNINGSSIHAIKGNFIGNLAHGDYINRSALGGAIAQLNADTVIGSIHGDFIGNTAYGQADADSLEGANGAYGGAIYQEGGARIGSLTSDFISNYAYAYRDGGGAYGGTIYLDSSTIGSIAGEFNSNYTYSRGNSHGGAIALTTHSSINTINSDFYNNRVVSDATNGTAYGGAIYNAGTIEQITGSFIGNYAQSGSEKAHGGAIYNTDGGSITLYATDECITITGNYVLRGADQEKVYEGIYNTAGSSSDASSITFKSSDESCITVNDMINGSSTHREKQLLLIGDGSSSTRVMINNSIENQTVHVEGAHMKLGSNAGSDFAPASSALLINSSLHITTGDVVAAPEYLGVGNSIVNNGNLYLSSGVLSSNLLEGAGQVHLGTEAKLQLARDISVNQAITTSGKNISITGQGINANSALSGSIDVESSGESASLLLSQLCIDDLSMNLTSGATLTIEQVHISDDVHITAGDGARVLLASTSIAEGVEFYLEGGIFDMNSNIQGNVSAIRLEDVTLSNASSTSSAISEIMDLSEGSLGVGRVFTVDSNLSGHTLNILGDLNLELDLNDEMYEIFLKSMLTDAPLGLDFGKNEIVNAGINSASLSLRGKNYSLMHIQTQDGSGVFLVVPEPSSVSLGLLALTAFLLRRRR